MDDMDAEVLAECHDVLVLDAAEGLRVLLEGEVGGAPLPEQLGQDVGGLAPDQVQSRVQLAQALVQVLQALDEETPLVDALLGCAGVPGVEDENAAPGITVPDRAQKRRVVHQPQTCKVEPTLNFQFDAQTQGTFDRFLLAH